MSLYLTVEMDFICILRVFGVRRWEQIDETSADEERFKSLHGLDGPLSEGNTSLNRKR